MKLGVVEEIKDGAPMQNTCVNTRKDTGVDEPCYTMGNSAWDPDVPLQDPLDWGW